MKLSHTAVSSSKAGVLPSTGMYSVQEQRRRIRALVARERGQHDTCRVYFDPTIVRRPT